MLPDVWSAEMTVRMCTFASSCLKLKLEFDSQMHVQLTIHKNGRSLSQQIESQLIGVIT